MKFHVVLPLFLFLFLSVKMKDSTSSNLNSVCESFAAGETDALETLDALEVNIYDYSIGLNNTAKIFCG